MARAILRPATSLLLASVLSLAACGGGGGSAQQILDGSPYVAIPRSVEPVSAVALRTAALRALASSRLAAGTSFYLAVKRTELEGKFFLSGYMEQTFPDAVLGGGARSVGTRVVALRLEPDRLVLFDASDVNAASDVFDPTLIVEAWPVVTTSQEFNADPRQGEYVLVDPSAGLNQLSVISTDSKEDVPFRVGLTYLQDLERLDDGVAFRLVFTGETNVSVHVAKPPVEENPLRLSGTLGVALRHYAEGEGFTTPAKPEKDYFFLSSPRFERNTGQVVTTPAAWNVHEGMTPIRWTISPYLRVLAVHPKYGKYDLEGAIRKGIENWNPVFGYTALEAVVGEEGAWAGNDVTNFLWLDPDPRVEFAFANWRTNPNTGEIRGASVYFNMGMVDTAIALFDAPAPPVPVPADAGITQPRYVIGWGGMTPSSLCDRPFGPVATAKAARVAAGDALTPKQKVEAYVTGVILHEVGHTLGLRHNFKGSLVPPSSSIMEYIENEDQLLVVTPQRFDRQALDLLHGHSTVRPVDPFCTDEGQKADPECAKFDKGADPLVEFHAKFYNQFLTAYLAGTSDVTPGNGLVNELLAFVRAEDNDQMTEEARIRIRANRLRAYHLAFDPVSGINEPREGTKGERVDAWGAFMSQRLWFSEPAQRGTVVTRPPVDGDTALADAVVADAGGWVLDLNGVTTYPTRRLAVDVLKEVQVEDAYLELLEDQAVLLGEVPPGTQPEPLVADLLARIGAAVHPYYK